jgi:hypothetical protein
MRRALQVVIIAASLGVAVTPLPRDLVERLYSRRVYSVIQPRLTSFSNHLAFALFDVTLVAVITAVVAMWIIAFHRSARGTTLRTTGRLALDTGFVAALIYFWFLAAWGLNYQREPLRTQLDFQEDRITTDALRDLARRDVDEMNRLHGSAHREGWLELAQARSSLEAPFERVQHDLAMPWRAVAGLPKRSLLDLYFKRVAVDGMTDPFFLETLANQGLLPFERPFVVAHEWGHLAGYADESEANFLAWLVCLRGGESAQYSAWISLYGTIVSALPPRERGEASQRLQPGPRSDLLAINERVARQVNPAASRAGYAVYDRFLKANRVRAGVRSYNEVLRLLLGTRFNPDGSPVLRPGS